ncbi:NAD-dependent dehydratase [Arthrobacter sp. MYb229]|uniref:SDR family oxidoreductase n=1 Tax=unclassified Arthrobacter TaxID=235627 RepID=UPI000CFAA86F|nr:MULTISPECIES: SDR family oxidoreductase [unclassified Arthrobacter]PRA04668.1 NAD-dependent dehydratase [Arthrobacter sp. MYb229]PRB51418.1 NAD-dependent dehydratase [Arthrobacter sp. MYb216]
MAETNRVVILGGHGKIALLAAPKLARQGLEVESVIRNPDHAEEITALGATPVVLDIEQADVDSLARQFAGAKAVVFSAGAGGGNPERTLAVDYQAAVRTMQAAQQAGVKRFVMVSYSRAAVDVDTLDPEDSFYGYAKAKHDADEYLRGTDLDYTILGPGALTLDSSTGQIVRADAEGKIQGRAVLDGKSNTSRENVAEVITHVLAKDAATRRTVNFYDGSTPIAEAIG